MNEWKSVSNENLKVSLLSKSRNVKLRSYFTTTHQVRSRYNIDQPQLIVTLVICRGVRVTVMQYVGAKM